MLTEDQKQTIRDEEVYRREVQTTLAKSVDSGQSGLLKFLNSSLGVWLLSAVFITLGGYAASQFSHRYEENRTREESIRKLDSEIGYRFSQIVSRLYLLSDKNLYRGAKLGPGKSVDEVKSTIRLFHALPKDSSDLNSLYPEYASANLFGIIAQQRTLLRTKGENVDEHDHVLGDMTEFPKSEMDLRNVGEVAGFMLDHFMINRWKRDSFFYTDCSGDKPFC